jgi:long-subunit acyl-CoA synthetase (AMP-forming)
MEKIDKKTNICFNYVHEKGIYMENDLKEYREKLAKLSEQEKKLRDLYLHNLSSGTIQGPETGYPSIDKSWLKYEKRQNVNLNYKNMSMIDFAYENNKNNLDDEFLIYNQGNVRRSITYREFFKIVEQYAQCLRNDYLIKVDDKIGVPMPTTPESIFLLYSLITIGAVPVFNDVRKSQKSIVEWLKLFGKEPKLIFTYDGILNKIGNSLKEMSYKSTKIIPVSGIEFLSNDKKMKKLNNLMHIKSFCSSKINNYNTESFSDFQKKCEKYEKVDNFSSHYVAGRLHL